MRILAIDQGTTSTRGLVFEAGMAPRLAASFRHAQHYPRPGWVEHDPLELLANVRGCIAAAGPIDAIGLANQGESCLAWDADTLLPLSPLLVWQDSRTEDHVARLREAGHARLVGARTGLPLDSYFSATKLAWIVAELPAARAALREGRLRLGTSDSFFLEHLTGIFATDATTASRTALMRLDSLAWDPDLCALFGVPIDALPPIRSSTGPFGSHAGVPVRAALVDQQAALHGHGATTRGAAKVTFGTGAFALVYAGADVPNTLDDGLIATVALSRGGEVHYALEGGVYDAGAAVEWLRRIGLLDDPATIAASDGAPQIEGGAMFVPALSGLACPDWSRDARALWAGLAIDTSREDLQRSVLEGIALQTCEVLAALDARIPLESVISIDGGLAESDYFAQFLADAAGREILRQEHTELTAHGCALLAGHDGPPLAAGRRFVPRTSPAQREAWRARYRGAVARALG